MVREPCRFWIVRKHADGHVRVDVLELAQDGLQDRLIARVALAIRPADRHAAALFLWLRSLAQDRPINVELVVDGRLGGVHPLRFFIEILPELLSKRRILDEPHHIGSQGIDIPRRKEKSRYAGLHHIGDAADRCCNRRAAHSRALHERIRRALGKRGQHIDVDGVVKAVRILDPARKDDRALGARFPCELLQHLPFLAVACDN